MAGHLTAEAESARGENARRDFTNFSRRPELSAPSPPAVYRRYRYRPRARVCMRPPIIFLSIVVGTIVQHGTGEE